MGAPLKPQKTDGLYPPLPFYLLVQTSMVYNQVFLVIKLPDTALVYLLACYTAFLATGHEYLLTIKKFLKNFDPKKQFTDGNSTIMFVHYIIGTIWTIELPVLTESMNGSQSKIVTWACNSTMHGLSLCLQSHNNIYGTSLPYIIQLQAHILLQTHYTIINIYNRWAYNIYIHIYICLTITQLASSICWGFN